MLKVVVSSSVIIFVRSSISGVGVTSSGSLHWITDVVIQIIEIVGHGLNYPSDTILIFVDRNTQYGCLASCSLWKRGEYCVSRVWQTKVGRKPGSSHYG